MSPKYLYIALVAGIPLLLICLWIQRPIKPVEQGLLEDARSISRVPATRAGRAKEAKERLPISKERRAEEKGGIWLLPDLAEYAVALNTSVSPEGDIAIIQELLTVYRRANGGSNPIGGSHEEIIEQMCGKNAKKLAVLPPDLHCINAEAQLLDRWGTPYFFHPLSGQVMEILSAGPDRQFWTEDDIAPDLADD